ncbi:hypothetical protein RB195_026333 [Necator americanus]|uniref:Uncharacterized protein n=1 Tax=Necator americanus TaxID=51031 RepID=A0ABR1EWI3_NECAM
MDGPSRHDKIGKSFSWFNPLKAICSDVEFLSRSSGFNFGPEIANNDLVKGTTKIAEACVRPHVFIRRLPVQVVICSKDVHCHTRVDDDDAT